MALTFCASSLLAAALAHSCDGGAGAVSRKMYGIELRSPTDACYSEQRRGRPSGQKRRLPLQENFQPNSKGGGGELLRCASIGLAVGSSTAVCICSCLFVSQYRVPGGIAPIEFTRRSSRGQSMNSPPPYFTATCWMLRPSRAAVELTNVAGDRRGGGGAYQPVLAGLPRKMDDDPRVDRQGELL